MTYEYRCEKCADSFDVIKSVKDMDVNEFCPQCALPARRQFVPTRLHIVGAKVEHAEYNPGLGQVVHNKRHREEICKRRGLVEVGNDYKTPDAMHAESDSLRESRRQARYEEALKDVGDAI